MRRFVLSAVLLLAVGCSRPAEVETPSSLAAFYTGTPQVFNAKQEGWKIGVLEPRDEGRDLSLDEWSTYEAVDRWIVVPIVIQNSSERRQKGDDLWSFFTNAGLVGTDDQMYELSDWQYDYNLEFDKPLEPGEARQVLLMFDVPEGVKPKRLLTDTYDTFNSLQIDF